MFNLFRYLIYKKIYCQDSGKNITLEGGFVTSDGDIYRSSIEMRIFQPRSMKDSKFKVNYRTSKEVQQDIKEKKLIRFGKLENAVRG